MGGHPIVDRLDTSDRNAVSSWGHADGLRSLSVSRFLASAGICGPPSMRNCLSPSSADLLTAGATTSLAESIARREKAGSEQYLGLETRSTPFVRDSLRVCRRAGTRESHLLRGSVVKQ